MNRPIKIAICGTGFWSNYQIPGWLEIPGVEITALYNRTFSRAEEVAKRFGIARVYDNIDELLERETIDALDIITDVNTHALFARKAAKRKVHVISQKPMAPDHSTARSMLDTCSAHGVQLFVHENFRWQSPIRAIKKVLDAGVIGSPFKSAIKFCSGFPVFENQPFLAELEQFILTDIGTHVLDIARFLHGEAHSVYCQTARVNPSIRGEDVANLSMRMTSGLHCLVELSYASKLEKEAFPQTLVSVEGSKGSVHLSHDFMLTTVTGEGNSMINCGPVLYDWCDPAYGVVHSSIVDCNRNILEGLRGGLTETTGADNFKTLQLVFAAYDSASKNEVVQCNQFF